MSAQDEEIAALRALVREQQAVIEALRTQVATLQARVEELTRQLGRSSRNSSQPPSSDGPAAPPPPTKPRSGKRHGAQRGHKGNSRSRMEPTEVHDLRPDACGACGHGLHGDDPAPAIHQHVEVPPLAAHVVEHRLHALRCPLCTHVTRAALPAQVSRSGFGPRLTALVAMLSVAFRLGKREVVALLAAVFGVPMALGSVSACERRVSVALEAPVNELHAAVVREAVANADETSWSVGRTSAWMWALAVKWAAVFLVAAKRSTEVAMRLLKGFEGLLISDRWCAYRFVPTTRRQLCWAHLLRHWEEFCGYAHAATKRLGEALKAQTRQMFTRWHQVLAGTLTRAQFRVAMEPIQRELERLLVAVMKEGIAGAASKAREIWREREALFTFVAHAGVDPTNNAAERVIRLAVRWRKNCFGTFSERGARFAERMLTVVQTLRLQGRSLFPWLVEALHAHQLGSTPPTLLRLADHPA